MSHHTHHVWFLFWDKVSYSLGWPPKLYVAQGDLELSSCFLPTAGITSGHATVADCFQLSWTVTDSLGRPDWPGTLHLLQGSVTGTWYCIRLQRSLGPLSCSPAAHLPPPPPPPSSLYVSLAVFMVSAHTTNLCKQHSTESVLVRGSNDLCTVQSNSVQASSRYAPCSLLPGLLSGTTVPETSCSVYPRPPSLKVSRTQSLATCLTAVLTKACLSPVALSSVVVCWVSMTFNFGMKSPPQTPVLSSEPLLSIIFLLEVPSSTIKTKIGSRAWWSRPIVLVTQGLRQEDH